MIVCSQCQFENPDNHKFCQQCGAPLTNLAPDALPDDDPRSLPDPSPQEQPMVEQVVPEQAVPEPVLDQPPLEQWLAVLCFSAPPKPTVMTSSSVTQPMPAAVMREVGEFLDPGDRYQLLEPLPDLSATVAPTLEINVRVVDRQANQPSYLDRLAQMDEPGTVDPAVDPSLALLLSELPATICQIPSQAEAYIMLQDEHYPAMPQIHDAWVQDDAERVMSVVVLEDRSTLPTLLHCMKNEDVLPLQVVMWLMEMVQFWPTLQDYGYCASILEPNNLHIDDGQVLCLQRLHPDYDGCVPSLKDLGHLWQTLFQQSQRTQLGALSKLCADLELEEITTLEVLQDQLEAIAQELQASIFEAELPVGAPVPLAEASVSNPFSEFSMSDPSQPDLTHGVPLSPPDGEDDFDPPTQPPLEAIAAGDAPEAADELDETEIPTMLPPPEDLEDNDDLPTIVLPMKLISLEDAGRTDIGQQRKHNEDYFSINTHVKKIDSPTGRTLQAKGLYILCDGMGGHAGGEVASALAVETLEQYFAQHWQDHLPSEQVLREGVLTANKAIYDLNQQNFRSGSGRMGTTLVLVLIQGTEAAIAHVGDSRLYRFTRRSGLEQLTVDHEVGQREIQRGVEAAIAYARPDAYQLTQALGPRDQNFVDPDIAFVELTEDALFLLCSDGLTDDNLLEKHWRTHVEPLLSSQTNLEQGLVQLIDLANHYNGHDNITGVVIRAKVRPDVAPPKRL
jgi:protein phosphatase